MLGRQRSHTGEAWCRVGCIIVGMAVETVTMTVHGMTCGNCARSVERKLASTPGVAKASVDLEKQSATVEYDAAAVRPEALAAAVRQIGFEVPA